MIRKLKSERYKGWLIKYLKFDNGYVRALALKNGNLYSQSTDKTKEDAKKLVHISIDQFNKHFPLNKISPLNEKAWSVKF